MASPVADNYSGPTGRTVAGGRFPALTSSQILADGVWTWFSDPRAYYHDGATYIGWVNSSGNVGITKHVHATGVATSFTLRAAMEVDDHDNVAVHRRPDGRILCVYGKHNDTSGIRYRISTSADDISAFGTEVLLTAGITTPISYSNVFYLSKNGKTYNIFRSGAGGVGTNPWGLIESSDHGSTWSSQLNFLSNTGARPYPKIVCNGYDRFDVVTTNCHPNEGVSSIYHFYGKLDASNNLLFYKTDGTLIGSTVTIADLTLIYNGSTYEAWVWDITYGRDGNPRVVFVQYRTTSDQRFMFSRWTGSAWTTAIEVATGGGFLYAGEQYYSGGISFDSQEPDCLYCMTPVGSFRELHEYRTTDQGATWVKVREITTGSSSLNARPYSPRWHDKRLRVLWWRGTYTSYVSYNTEIRGA